MTAGSHAKNEGRAASEYSIFNKGILTAAVILIMLILLMVTVTGAYRGVLKSKAAEEAMRGSLSYLRSQVKGHDAEGAVEIRDGGDMLVLKETDGEEIYELRIYLHEGKLVEEYTEAGEPKNPNIAEGVAETSEFKAEWLTDSVLKLITGEGTIVVRLFAAGTEAAQ